MQSSFVEICQFAAQLFAYVFFRYTYLNQAAPQNSGASYVGMMQRRM